MTKVTKPYLLTSAPPAGPSWLSGISVGAWGTVTTNTVASADPGTASPLRPFSRMFAYSGGIYAADYSTYGAMVISAGGHDDYYGNEVYAQDLSVANPSWVRCGTTYPTVPGTPSTIDGELAGSVNGDKPGPCHTYNALQYIPASVAGGKGKLLRPIASSLAQVSGGYSTARSHAFDFVTNLWSRFFNNVMPWSVTGGSSPAIAGCTAYDTSRNIVWWFPQGGFYSPRKLDVATGVSSTSSGGTIYTQFTDAAVYVPSIDRILHFSGLSTPWTITVINPATGAVVSATTPANGPTNQGAESGGAGVSWCADLGKVLVYPQFLAHSASASDDITGAVLNTGRIYGYDPAAGTWSTIINGTSVPTCYSGVWGRFQYVPSLKCAVVTPTTSSGTFAYKVA